MWSCIDPEMTDSSPSFLFYNLAFERFHLRYGRVNNGTRQTRFPRYRNSSVNDRRRPPGGTRLCGSPIFAILCFPSHYSRKMHAPFFADIANTVQTRFLWTMCAYFPMLVGHMTEPSVGFRSDELVTAKTRPLHEGTGNGRAPRKLSIDTAGVNGQQVSVAGVQRE